MPFFIVITNSEPNGRYRIVNMSFGPIRISLCERCSNGGTRSESAAWKIANLSTRCSLCPHIVQAFWHRKHPGVGPKWAGIKLNSGAHLKKRVT